MSKKTNYSKDLLSVLRHRKEMSGNVHFLHYLHIPLTKDICDEKELFTNYCTVVATAWQEEHMSSTPRPGHLAQARDQIMVSPGRHYSQTSYNFNPKLLFIFCVVVFLSLLDTTQATLSQCTITGTSGFCLGMAGKFIRRDFNPHIRALYIVSSDLTYLTADDFLPFQSLITLHIHNSSFSHLTYQDLLSGLKTLTALQITYSNLSDDILSMFVENTALNKLTLQWNKLTRITKETFSHLKDIESIDVSHNDISEIEEGAFENMPSLQTLNVAHNKIGEHFDPTLTSGDCSRCGEECPPACRSSADYLWQKFQKHYDIVFLKDNPICSKIEKAVLKKASHGETEREEFFLRVCSQEFELKKRDKNSNGDFQDVDSGHVVDSYEDSGDSEIEWQPDVDGEVPPSGELDGKDSNLGSEDPESRALVLDGNNSDDAELSLSAVEVDDDPVTEPGLKSMWIYLLLAASMGVVAVIAAAAVNYRRRYQRVPNDESARAVSEKQEVLDMEGKTLEEVSQDGPDEEMERALKVTDTESSKKHSECTLQEVVTKQPFQYSLPRKENTQ